MAFDVMKSLFDLTPLNVQKTLQAESEQRVQDSLGLLRGNPFAIGAEAPLRSGERLLAGARKLVGEVDPRMQVATQIQGIVGALQQQGVDLATPEGMVELAKELNKNPDLGGMALAIRQQASQMQKETKKAALSEQLITSQIEENKAQAAKALRAPVTKPEKVSREDRWVQLDTLKTTKGLSKEEDAEYKSLSRLLFKPEKGTEDTATARRWDLETQAARSSLTAQGVDWTKPLTGRVSVIPGIMELHQKANREPWSGAAKPATPTPSSRRTPKPLPPNPTAATLEIGQVYITARGNAAWNGTQFIPVTGQ